MKIKSDLSALSLILLPFGILLNLIPSIQGADIGIKGDCIGQCFCDDILPYLIECSGQGMATLFRNEEWEDYLKRTGQIITPNTNTNTTTNTTTNSTDTTADNKEVEVRLRSFQVRFNENALATILPFPRMNIVSLFFSANKIESIQEASFAKLTNLTSIDLSWNLLTAQGLPEKAFIGEWDKNGNYYFPLPLLSLNLSHNQIHSIDADLFEHLPRLESLDLSFNPLKIIGPQTSQSLSSLANLKVLYLQQTGIESIPDGVFHSITNLTSLDLSENEFTSVPKELKYCTNLVYLNLDGNKISSLDYTSFEGLIKLETLSLSHMPTLKTIEARTFEHLPKLAKLYLSFNPNLTELSDDAFRGISEKDEDWPIKEIHLNNNGFTHIDRALANWEHMEYIDIQNNPYKCDCKIEWMTENLIEIVSRHHLPQEDLLSRIVCTEPERYKGVSIHVLSLEPELFENCARGDARLGDIKNFNPEIHAHDPYRIAGMVLLVIGVMLVIIGMSILGVLLVKRKAIAQSLSFRQEIRYERAESEEDENHFGRKMPTVTVR